MDKVTITKLDHFGRGITNINDKICFIDKALPNEECEIEITNDKKNYQEGKLINIITKSDDRVIPDCPYYDLCGGCHLMHYDYSKQLEYKENKVKELLSRFASINDITIKPIIHGNNYNYRNKLTLHGVGNKIGLYQEKSNRLIEVDKCLITSEKINNVVTRLKNYFTNDEDIKSITIKTTSLNEIMLVIIGRVDANNFINSFSDIDSIYLNNNLIHGKETITETMNDLSFEIYPESFFQVNYQMMLEMYNKVINYYKDNTNLKVLDLYCGTGTIGMLIAKYCKEVIGVEVNKEAIESANKCKVKNNISNISFYLGKVEDKIDLFKDIDSIVVDPPRSGLDKHTIETILNLKPNSIIYVSCDPVTLARDLNILKEEYQILEVQPIDMFPNTYHVENVCILERKSS